MFNTHQTLKEKIDTRKDAVARKIDHAAETLRESTGRGSEKATQVADGVATRMHSAAEYLRKHDPSDVRNSIGNFFRRYPLEAALAALFLGIVAGRSMGRR